MSAPKIGYVDFTEEELLSMSHEDAVEGLPEKRQRFCEFYIGSHNAKTAAIKAGYEPDQARQIVGLIKRSERCRRYIAWLKIRVLDRCMISGEELIEAWTRIAFADITDFLEIYPNHIALKPADMMDGQLVKSIKSGRDGISIELYDKMKALDSLAKYADCMPMDWKQKLEERKVALLEAEFELKKKSYGTIDEDTDDGFLQALAKSAETVWSDEAPETEEQ